MKTVKLSSLLTDERIWVRWAAESVLKEMGELRVPLIPDLHTRILEQVEKLPVSFDMSNYHGVLEDFCNTSHCYAGWVEVFAGKRWFNAGRYTSHRDIGYVLVGASFPDMEDRPSFYANNEQALEHITKWAQFEKKAEAAQ